MPNIASPTVSAIVTTYNEGPELHRTLASVVANTSGLVEVLVVDDGSTDGSCEELAQRRVRVIRHQRRLGVARCRDEASRAARGDVLCYLDAHQRVGPGCLDRCARVAVEREGITCPDLRSLGGLGWRKYGADFRLCPQRGYFSARWRTWRWRRGIARITGLRAPPYLVPRRLYDQVAWGPGLEGWGASESSIVVKAFFTGLPIFNVGGPLAQHLFRKSFHYETSWDGIWRNHALIARVCFDKATWHKFWLPRVFDAHLNDDARALLGSAEVQAEHAAFQARKVRTDRQFWSDLLGTSPPEGI